MEEASSTPSDENGIGRRLRLFRKSYAGCHTQKEFAAALAIDQQRLSGYENGTRVPHHVLAAFVRIGANPYWLLFGEGPMRGTPPPGENVRQSAIQIVGAADRDFSERQFAEFYVLPLFADEAAVDAPPGRRETAIEGPAIIHRAWCANPGQTDCVRVNSTGRSMEPTIPAGAVVAIDRSETDPNRLVGRIVALTMRDGGVVLRRLRRGDRGGFIGVPDNRTPEHTAVGLDDDGRVAGVVVALNVKLA